MKVSREKAALGIFLVLALAGLGALIAYIVTVGHSLNIAANNIDDATGNLDDYTVILYEGTATEHRESVVNDSPDIGAALSSHVLNMRSTQDDAESSSDEVSATDTQSSDSTDEDEEETSVSLFALQRSYVDKNARVVVLNVTDLSTYNEPTVVRAGSHIFGILSIDEVTAQQSYFQKRISDYEARDVDFIVCVVSDISLLDSYEGADIVISAQDEGLAANGVSVDGVFYDDAALVGHVGTVLVSPSRTITARDATSL